MVIEFGLFVSCLRVLDISVSQRRFILPLTTTMIATCIGAVAVVVPCCGAHGAELVVYLLEVPWLELSLLVEWKQDEFVLVLWEVGFYVLCVK